MQSFTRLFVRLVSINSENFCKILLICVKMAKPEICSTSFASRQSKTQKDNVRDFYIFIKVLYQQNCDIINDIIDYLLCSVLSNELFIKVILLSLVGLLWVRYCCAVWVMHNTANYKPKRPIYICPVCMAFPIGCGP